MALLQRNPMIGGDQSPLRQGFLRAAVMANSSTFLHPTHYLWQDADAVVSSPNGLSVLPGIFPVHDARLWTTFEVNLPFMPLGVNSTELRGEFGVGNSSASSIAKLFRQYLGTYRYYVNPGVTDQTLIGANLTFRKWPILSSLFVESIRMEADWAVRFLEFAGMSAREANERRNLVLSYARSASLLGSGVDIGYAFFALARGIMRERLRRVQFSTITAESRLTYRSSHGMWFSVLRRFVTDTDLVAMYNQVTSSSKKRHIQGELPFWVVPSGPDLHRYTLNISDLGLTQTVQSVIKKYGEGVRVVPKALLLLLQLCQIGHPYMTELSYADDSARVAKALSIPMYHGNRITFDFKKALGPLWPSDLDFWPKHSGGVPEEVIHWAKKRALRYWRQRPTLVFAYVLGGDDLLDVLIRGAKVERYVW